MGNCRVGGLTTPSAQRSLLPVLVGPTALQAPDAAGADSIEEPDELALRGPREHTKRLLVGQSYRLVELGQQRQAGRRNPAQHLTPVARASLP